MKAEKKPHSISARKKVEELHGVSKELHSISARKKIEELHGVSKELVGRIVEKGFSPSGKPQRNPSSAFPQPTLLPFPVARHRSHGPHWSPAGTKPVSDEVDSEEDRDDTNYDPLSSFADPIERREKKDLDLSRWREFVDGNGSAAPQPKRREANATASKEATKMILPTGASPSASSSDAIDEENRALLEEMSAREISEAHTEIMEKTDPALLEMLKRRGRDKLRNEKGSEDLSNEGVNGSAFTDARVEKERYQIHGEDKMLEHRGAAPRPLTDDIHEENLERLRQMSADEIAEAQAEITEKLKPSMLEMLKKRRRGKIGNGNGQTDSRVGRSPESGNSSKAGASIGDTLSPDEPNKGNGSPWKLWSNRVENVRAMRFTLDGNVLETNPINEESDGNRLDYSQYSIDNVAERDILRTEGDPASVGYTIKEAVELIRSMVPAQRVLALQLLASILKKSIQNLEKKNIDCVEGTTYLGNRLEDWQAAWAFALGPEPEMALSLRIAIDDNHDSVVFSCAKLIQCILSCDVNEKFFDIKEKNSSCGKGICTAPVFRSKPEVDGGLLHGGFWKYNTKSSNILPSTDMDEDDEGEHTIQDDVVVAAQDVVAGLVRMGIVPRICYLLEMDPLPALEECLVSLLIAIARHSPTCANAIMVCPRLIQTVSKIFTKPGTVETHPSQIKAVVLLKVLSQSSKQNCLDLVKRGVFQQAMWHWYRHAFTLDHWIKSGKEHCRLVSAMMVEQLRLWKVCIRYGYCITYFPDFFPAVCLWLTRPTFDKLIESSVLCEFASITREAYLVLEALAQRLPTLHSSKQLDKRAIGSSDTNMEVWSWSHVVPMVDLAMAWLSLKDISHVSSVIGNQSRTTNHSQDPFLSCMLWVISAVLHMLCSILDRIAPANNSHFPWLPQFVPKVGLELVTNGFLKFSRLEENPELRTQGDSLAEALCYLRHQQDNDTSLSSVSCLHGLVRLASSVDNAIARNASSTQPHKGYNSTTYEKILGEGLIGSAQIDLLRALNVFVTMVSSEWHVVQSIEMFGRGGPAPGVGVGWGSSGGGFWSFDVLLAQMDARLILDLLDIFHVVVENDIAIIEEIKPAMEVSTGVMTITAQKINSVLGVCLISGPGDRAILDKAFGILFEAPVLRYLSFCIRYFFHCNQGFKSFDCQYNEADYLLFGKNLNTHFRNRWLSIKSKPAGEVGKVNHNRVFSQNGASLETILEDPEMAETADGYPDCNSLLIEWAHQRLPLPVHWFLSAICSIGDVKSTSADISVNVTDVAKSGLFFLLGLEAMNLLLSSNSQYSPVSVVPLVCKVHSLSMALHLSMDVLEEERCRNVFETLQELYGRELDKLLEAKKVGSLEVLNFRTQLHESYATFVENLVEQFGAISYGDVIYGRQVTLYLHRSAESAVRLAAWNALSNAHVLELLPPLEKCIGEAEGYLEPAECDEGILESYAKSWMSGGLDRAMARGSASFTLALHHLSCFIFSNCPSGKSKIRNKLAKSLIRSYLQKQYQQGMLLDLVRHKLPVTRESESIEIKRRFELLKEACEENSSLLGEVEKLKSSVL